MNSKTNRISIAPMMDYTDRYCRYFLRLISRNCLLYTEMVTTGALLHGDRQRFLAYDEIEHPIALQLGGSDPRELAICAKFAQQQGYDEINLNCGCPSDRVLAGKFGASLMLTPAKVAQSVAAMRAAVSVPVTVKHRIGVDNQDSYQQLCDFVGTIADAGCGKFVVHARKAWLQGLSPKQNREVPPLQYQTVYRLKQDFPQLEIILNGGITQLDEVATHLQEVDGVMIGREAYHNPYILADVDRRFYQDRLPNRARSEVIEAFASFVDKELARGTRLQQMLRHVLGLYNGAPGARRFRRYISENATAVGAGAEVLREAVRAMAEAASAEHLHDRQYSPLL